MLVIKQNRSHTIYENEYDGTFLLFFFYIIDSKFYVIKS
jgi:hypothetical protein